MTPRRALRLICLVFSLIAWNSNPIGLLEAAEPENGPGEESNKTGKKIEKEEETFGAEPNPTGDPIGGGKGYRRLASRGDFEVRTSEELLVALKKAKAGQ